MISLGETYGFHGEFLYDAETPMYNSATPLQSDESLYHVDAEKKANILIN
jgi:hypothetical protein